MANPPISLIVLTHNEEVNLSQCLKNAKSHIDEIIIVDSYSDDKTVEIAERYGAYVVQHEFENQAKQFNWALDNLEIKNEWVLRLDADEWVTGELWDEIAEKLASTPQEVNGYIMKRRVYFMGRWMRHGGYYPAWFLRLFRNGKARYEEREVDEHLVLTEGKAVRLKHDFVDENHKPLGWWIEKHNNYAGKEAREALKLREGELQPEDQAGRKRRLKNSFYYKLPPFFRAFLYWKYRYILRLGFLDGKEGLIFHALQGFWYRLLVDAKIYEVKRGKKT